MHIAQTMTNTEAINDNLPFMKNWESFDLSEFGWLQFQKGELYEQQKNKDRTYSTLKQNLSLAASLAEDVLKHATNILAVDINKVLLHPESIYQFRALFIIKEDDFYSEKLRAIFDKTELLNSEFNSDEFYLSFHIIPYSAHLNMELIHYDGFILSYAGN